MGMKSGITCNWQVSEASETLSLRIVYGRSCGIIVVRAHIEILGL